MKQQCCGGTAEWNKWTGKSKRCSRPGSIEVEGKFYCAQHRPGAQEERRDASYAKWRAEARARERAARIQSVKEDVVVTAERFVMGEGSLEGLRAMVERLQAERRS